MSSCVPAVVEDLTLRAVFEKGGEASDQDELGRRWCLEDQIAFYVARMDGVVRLLRSLGIDC